MSNLNFAPGESNISATVVRPSLVLFWLKTEMAVTSRRVVTREPNTILGLVPLGYDDAAYPLNNVASAGVSIKFSLFRAVFGAIFFLLGLSLLGSSAFLGFVVTLFGVSMLANALSSVLTLVNNGGGVSAVKVNVLDKRKLELFRDEVNHRLFADHDRMRHEEAMRAQATGQAMNYTMQEQQLRAMQQGFSGMQQQQPQMPQAPTAAIPPVVPPTQGGTGPAGW